MRTFKVSHCHFIFISTVLEWVAISSPGVWNGNPLQYSCWENSMDRGAWRATVHGVTKSQRPLSDRAHRHTPYWEDGHPPATLSLLRKAPTQAQSAGEQPLPWLWSLGLSSIVNSLPYTSNLFKSLGLEKDLAFSWLPSVVSKPQVLPLRKSLSFLSLLLLCPLAILPWSFTVSCKHQVALVAKNPLANTGDIRDTGSIPGLGRSLGDGHGNSSILAWRIPMDRGAWWATGRSVVESDTTEAT